MELLHRDGVLAVRGIVDLAHVAALRESMTATAKDVAAGKDKGKITQFNQGVASNFLMAPPLTDERLLFEDVYANGFVHEIAKAYLGPGINLHLLTGNCAMPRTEERQAVHRDLPWIAPEAPFVLNMNLLLTGAAFPLFRSLFRGHNKALELKLTECRQTSPPTPARPSSGSGRTTRPPAASSSPRRTPRARCATSRRRSSRRGGRPVPGHRSSQRPGRCCCGT